MTNLVMWNRKKFLFETLVTPVILYGCEVWGCSISRESWRNIEQIHKRFITYNLKIKSNTPYPILLIEVGLSPIESLAMTRLLLYKHKLNNIGDHRLPKLALNSSQNHLRLKRGWYKDTRAWLNHQEIGENVALQNINNIKNIVTSKFKEKMWCEKDLATKIKLSYYKKVINPTLEDQKYLSILTSSKKKINIAKIRTNSHELHSETGRWAVPKTPWMERICHICENRNIEDENHFLLECPAYNHIRSQFHNLCYNTDLPSLLQCQNYSELGRLLSKLFEHRNKILNQNK